jgi:hypothetical protein
MAIHSTTRVFLERCFEAWLRGERRNRERERERELERSKYTHE